MAIAETENLPYRQCTRCILDTNDCLTMSFDDVGVCDNCRKFDEAWKKIPKTKNDSDALLAPIIKRIKTDGENKKYDCIIGISGGVDSSYIALLVKKMGLRPLAVHFDNGWNSELAVKNIEKIISSLDIDLYTYVINWEDFKQLQLAYLKASVVDIEVLTDHAIYGAMYKIANQYKIKTIISGVNVATEYILPHGWTYNKFDYINIKSIFKKFGQGKISSYPFVDKKSREAFKRSNVQFIQILDLIPFNVKAAVEIIERDIGWVSYEGKHFESIFTRFYQGYILPRKFGIDKRKAHLSNLICSSQMTRREAILEMNTIIYSEVKIAEDMEFVLKKLGLSMQEFTDIMSQPIRQHQEFDVEGAFFSRYPFLKPAKPLWEAVRKHVC